MQDALWMHCGCVRIKDTLQHTVRSPVTENLNFKGFEKKMDTSQIFAQGT